MASRIIRATHNNTTVRVYQAYNDEIADAALEGQSFESAMQKGLWSSRRMTWIKPSKVWMAYRCGWTTLKDFNQARVLALDLDRTKFEEILAQATVNHPEKHSNRIRHRGVVVQWDPERVMNSKSHQVYTKPLKQVRSIQIGLRPPANQCLLDTQVVKRITDVTQDLKNALSALQEGRLDDAAALLWQDGQEETILELPVHIRANLNMSPSSTKDTDSLDDTGADINNGINHPNESQFNINGRSTHQLHGYSNHPCTRH